MISVDFTDKEFRRLLDLVYVGNWVLNSTRMPNDRFEDYDIIQEKIFYLCTKSPKLDTLADSYMGRYFPSRGYEEGGIHEVISQYEDDVFFDILAEELAHRDIVQDGSMSEDSDEAFEEISVRVEEYLDEFEQNGLDNVRVENMQ